MPSIKIILNHVIKAAFAGMPKLRLIEFVKTVFTCRRLRSIKPDEQKYRLDLETLQVNEHSLEAELINLNADAKFKFTLTALEGDTFRVFIDEVNPLFPRYVVYESLTGEPQVAG